MGTGGGLSITTGGTARHGGSLAFEAGWLRESAPHFSALGVGSVVITSFLDAGLGFRMQGLGGCGLWL